VPLVAIPLGNDQPGVAARIAARGAGIVITPSKLSATRLRAALQSVLQQQSYRSAATAIKDAMEVIDGKARAADIIEDTLGIRARDSQQPALATGTSPDSSHLPAAS